MPYFADRIWPEVTDSMNCTSTLRVVIDDAEVANSESDRIQEAGGLLNRYFADLLDRQLKIEVATLPSEPTVDPETTDEANLVKESGEESLTAAKAEQARTLDADVVVTKTMSFESRTALEREHQVTIVDAEGATRVMEYFAAGHNVPWSFRLPCWNMPWTSFYSMTDEDGKRGTTAWMSAQFKRLLSADAQEIFRSLAINRLEYILYTRDMLLFYRLQRRAAKRRKAFRQNFNLEVGHLMGHYFGLLTGGLDQLARIMKEALNLRVTNRVVISLLNPQFVGKIKAAHPQIGNLFTDKKYTKWKTTLKLCRDFITHSGTAHPVKLVHPPESEVSDDEIDRLVRERPEYRTVMGLTDDLVGPALEILRQNVKATTMGEVWLDDALVIQDSDKQYTVLPLRDIEWNYDNYSRIVFATLDLLEETTGEKS